MELFKQFLGKHWNIVIGAAKIDTRGQVIIQHGHLHLKNINIKLLHTTHRDFLGRLLFGVFVFLLFFLGGGGSLPFEKLTRKE